MTIQMNLKVNAISPYFQDKGVVERDFHALCFVLHIFEKALALSSGKLADFIYYNRVGLQIKRQ